MWIFLFRLYCVVVVSGIGRRSTDSHRIPNHILNLAFALVPNAHKTNITTNESNEEKKMKHSSSAESTLCVCRARASARTSPGDSTGAERISSILS